MPRVCHDNAPGNGQTKTRATRTLREEGLKDTPLLLGWDAGSGIADRHPHLAVLSPHFEPQAPVAIHGLYPVQGNIPEHLGELRGVKGTGRDGRVHTHLYLHAASWRALIMQEGRHVPHHLADISHDALRLLRAGEGEEVSQGSVEAARL